MCDNCFTTEIHRFDSYRDFDEFEEILRQKIDSNNFTAIWEWGSLNSDDELIKSTLPHTHSIYKCSSCGEKWALSIPENAWRGYFLTVDEASEEETEIKDANRKSSRGCIVIFVIIILLIVAAIIN